MLKRTPLFSAHQALGARLIEFGGWEMPVLYSGIVEEHLAVRQAAGIFDISHMGEVVVGGPAALPFLNGVLTNDLRVLAVGQGQYTLMCQQKGGVLDDLYAYRLEEERYLLVLNASRIEADTAWLRARWADLGAPPGSVLEDRSASTGAVAVQGPKVAEFIDAGLAAARPCGGTAVTRPTDLKKNQACELEFEGARVLVARTGYTGEDGFEVLAPAERLETIWQRVLEVGQPWGLKPCGLGARDTLRLEMGYPLYGHELDEETTPIEAGLGFFVALDKGDFVGRPVLLEQKRHGTRKQCVALRLVDKSAPPRAGYPIWSSGLGAAPIGKVVSGTQSPSLGVGVGMGYVPPEFSRPGTELAIEIRGARARAVVVPKPIYKKPV
jgi:aminomethyltransferase